jgi:DNA-binding transcriptional regulator YiaG
MSVHDIPCGACGAVGAYDQGCPECRVPPEEPLTPGEQLQMARRLRGLSQSKAAALIGVPVRTYQNWEIGYRRPPDYVLRLALERLAPRV